MTGSQPLLMPADLEGDAYQGYLQAAGRQFEMRITGCKHLPTAQLHCSQAASSLLAEHSQTIQQRLSQARDLEDFLVELKHLLERAIAQEQHRLQQEGGNAMGGGVRANAGCGGGHSSNSSGGRSYSRVVAELDDIGWDCLVSMDDRLECLEIRVVDSAGRGHALSVVLPSDYPVSPPTCHMCLPEPVTSVGRAWNKGARAGGGGGGSGAQGGGSGGSRASLAAVVAEYQAALTHWQPLFDQLDDLDQHCWVVEPEKPTREACFRRIAIGNHRSLHIVLDPARPNAAPQSVMVYGSDSLVRPLREALNAGLGSWDGSTTVRANLERIMGIMLPARPRRQGEGGSAADEMALEEHSAECGICYSLRAHEAGELPEKVCNNPKCGRPYHNECLVEWLHSLPNTVQSFGTLFGKCPYCSDSISAKTR